MLVQKQFLLNTGMNDYRYFMTGQLCVKNHWLRVKEYENKTYQLNKGRKQKRYNNSNINKNKQQRKLFSRCE